MRISDWSSDVCSSDLVAATADLAATVRERTEFWSLLAEEDGRAWTADVPGGPVPVQADAEELEALLDSLLGNVNSHTPAGTPYAVLLTVESAWYRSVEATAGPVHPDPGPALGRGGYTRGREPGW